MTIVPGFWMNEQGGALRPAVLAYLDGQDLDAGQLEIWRAYLRQWMQGDWKGPLLDTLRSQVDDIKSTDDLHHWLHRALSQNIDPL